MLVGHWTVAQTTITGNVSDGDNGDPLIGASIIIRGTYIGTLTDENGNFELSTSKTPPFSIEISYTGYGAKEIQVVNASDAINVLLSAGLNMNEVTVVGSRVRQRTNLDKAVPVDLIGQKQLRHSAQADVTQILQYTAPSFHSTPQTISDGTDHIDPAALRGLGPDQTLVLVNGKRRHTSSLLNVNGTVGRGTVGTDLNAIPAAAIDRIEVLRDGAAAQYGSDAIAGVINIILKDKPNTGSINFQTGVTRPNAFGGPDGGNVPDDLIPEFANDGGMYQISGNLGLGLMKDKGFLNVTFSHSDRSSTNRSGNYTGSIYPEGYDDARSDEEFFSIVRKENGFVENQVMEIGNSAIKNSGVFLNASLPLNDNGTELYANAGLNFRKGVARGFYRFPAAQARVVPQLYRDGFSPQIHSDVFDRSFVIGVRGNIGAWKADLSQVIGGNQFDFDIKNSNNASLGTASPTEAYAGGFSYGQMTTNFDMSREVKANFPISIAFGAEFRNENYQIKAGEEASYVAGGAMNEWLINGQPELVAGAAGIQVFPGFQPQNELDKNRTNIGVYSEFDFEFTESFLVSVAGRYENYSDFGSNLSGKLATRVRLNDQFGLRGSVSSGFRAPSLHQIYFNNLSTQFVPDPVTGDQIPVQVGTFNNDSEVARAFGIDPLKPETSVNYSVGLTGRVNDNFAFTIDGYLIDIQDRIVISGRFSPGEELAGGVLAGDILTPLGAGAAQFFTNAVSTQTKGLDIVGSYRSVLEKGTLNFTLACNFTETEVDKKNGVPVIKTSDLLEGKENVLFNREEVSRIEVAQPKSKIAFSVLYEMGKFSALLRATRFGEITYIHPGDGSSDSWKVNDFTGKTETRDQVFSPKIVPDVEFAYDFTKMIRWTLGIHNFTNTFPDMHQHSANVSSGRFLFSRRVQQFGVRGMFIYTKVGLSF